MTSLYSGQIPIVERFACPQKGCKAVLRSKLSFEIHIKYFHKEGTDSGNAQLPENESEEQGGSNTSESTRPYRCDDKECANKKGRKNTFKCYAALKQHFLNFHAEKMFSCKKCGKMFSEDAKKTRHEFDCSVFLVCSCGIKFSGKNGLLMHAKRTRHNIPPAVEEFLHQKRERKCLGKKPGENVKLQTVVPVVPKGAFSTPSLTFKKKGAAPILPKLVLPKAVDSFFPAVSSNCNIAVPGVGSNRLMKSRIVVDIYHPPEIGEQSNRRQLKKRLIAPKNLDSLSVAMVKSGIGPLNESAPAVPPSSDSCILSKTSQTDWTVTNQSAQDFSCQTDEFLAWLDSESAKCSSNDSNCEYALDTNLQSKMHGNQYAVETKINSSVSNDGNMRTVAQHETQTDDDWLSALLHEAESVGNEVSDAESQTNAANFGSFGICYNSNVNNNNACTDVLVDTGCDIQTQTAIFDAMADVTTQTGSLDYGITDDSASASSLFFNLANNIQTQTEDEMSFVNTTHTQTAWQCGSDITEFFSMQTQTDSLSRAGVQLTASQTQTWKES